ncbi:UNKNOWN [Stylonychia lemnae]|uniref:Uncharacterized protein n=1 Tax=Stylonychia lemnae TaxID=5949 RepID=A0A078B3P7_STYLE|nr:UNKNOWN [Stylonychia lemnae]|eukprot:CDW89160.1 UNKNOWN [Stylonychia lemnae]
MQLQSLQSNQIPQLSQSTPQTNLDQNHKSSSQRSPHTNRQNKLSPKGQENSQRNKMPNHVASKYSILDREERDLINQAANLSKEEIWERLEQKRFNQLKKAAVNLQGDMIFNQRCPKCTLQPPCKHYQSSEQIIQEGTHLIQQQQFRQHLSPKKREVILKTLRDQQRANQMLLQNSQEVIMNQVNQSQISTHSKQTLQMNENDPHMSSFNNQQQESPDATGAFMTSLDGTQPDQMKDAQGSHNQQDLQSMVRQSLVDPTTNRKINRNHFNNTVTGAQGAAAFRHSSEQKYDSYIKQSNLSQYGANVMNQNQQKRQFLRKRQGNGGSPTDQSFVNESRIGMEGPLIPKNQLEMHQNNRDRTTVRIRTKNNQYLINEASFTQPLYSAKNNQQSFMENSQQSLYERERLQAVIAKYKEDKIQRQIERIEQERMQLELEKKYQKDQDIKRRQYIEKQKQKLQEYQEVKMQQEQEKSEYEKMERMRWEQRERLRRDYFESQKKYIVDYRVQKRKTDELLMIPSQYQSKNSHYNASQVYYQPLTNNGGIMTKAGQQFISSGPQKLNNPKIKIGPDGQPYDDEDEYYGEVYPQVQGGNLLDASKRQNNNSTGIIGQYDKLPQNQENQANLQVGGDPSGDNTLNEGQDEQKPLMSSKKDSLDLIGGQILQ